MDIRCERCGAEYEIDASQVGAAGLPVRCAACQHVFKVFRPSAPVAQPAMLQLRLHRGGAAQVIACPDRATLQRWILEHRLLREDELFDDGRWLALGVACAEVFEMMEAASRPLPASPAAASLSTGTTPTRCETPRLSTGSTPSAALSEDTVPSIGGLPSFDPVPADRHQASFAGLEPLDADIAAQDAWSKPQEAEQADLSLARTELEMRPAAWTAPEPQEKTDPSPAFVQAMFPATEPLPEDTVVTASPLPPETESPAASDEDDELDPEILAFQQRARRGKLLAVAVIVLVAAAAAVAYTMWPAGPATGTQTASDTQAAVTPPSAPEVEQASATPEPEAPEAAAAASPSPTPEAVQAAATPEPEPTKAPAPAPVKTITAQAPKKAEVTTAMAPPPVDVDKLLETANRQLERGQQTQAVATYDKVLAANPRHSEALYGKGVALYDLGRNDQAISALSKALDANPRFGDAAVMLAEAYKQKGQSAEAVRWYRRYLEIMPNGDMAVIARTNIEQLK